MRRKGDRGEEKREKERDRFRGVMKNISGWHKTSYGILHESSTGEKISMAKNL